MIFQQLKLKIKQLNFTILINLYKNFSLIKKNINKTHFVISFLTGLATITVFFCYNLRIISCGLIVLKKWKIHYKFLFKKSKEKLL